MTDLRSHTVGAHCSPSGAADPVPQTGSITRAFLIPTEQFSRCVAASKEVRWDIEVRRHSRPPLRPGEQVPARRAHHREPAGLRISGQKVYFSQGSTVTRQCCSCIEDDIRSPIALYFKRNRIPTTRNHCVNLRSPNSHSVASCCATRTPPQSVKSGAMVRGRRSLACQIRIGFRQQTPIIPNPF
jgi:hypothetical protein